MSAEYGHYVPPDINITRFSTGHTIQRTTVNERFIMVEDPQLGDFVIGGRDDNGLYYDYLTTANAYRSGGVSQLCKDTASSTIPNAASMTRRWHIQGLFKLVEDYADERSLDPTTRLAYHLATDADDQGHLLFSHALEASMQAGAHTEDFHEHMWPRVAELGGTAAVLRKHDVVTDDKLLIPGIELPPCIDAKAPDINFDRFQYAVTEMLLWFDHDEAPQDIRTAIRSLCSPEVYSVDDDGRMVFNDVDHALLFSKGYLLLTTEHWNEPINRVQLHLLVQATQRAILKRRIIWMDEVDRHETRQPAGYLYGIDQDIVDAMRTGSNSADGFMHAIRSALYPIAMQERNTFLDYKLGEYSGFLLDARARDYPSRYLTPKRVEFGPPAAQVAVTMRPAEDSGEQIRLPQLDTQADGINYSLGPLKNRYVDPLVATSTGVKRLSEIDDNFANLLQQQQALQHMHTQVELAFSGTFTEAFRQGVKQNEHDFDALGARSEMTHDQHRRVIELAAARAKVLGQEAGSLILKNTG